MDIQHALATAAATRDPELHRLYRIAVARGGNITGLSTEAERELEVSRLLTLALLRLPDLVLSGYLLATIGKKRADQAVVARTARDVSAGTLRLAHRALEVHGRQVGYRTEAWTEQAVLQASEQLAQYAAHRDARQPVALDEARAATASLVHATETTSHMQLSEQLADALGHLLAIHAIAQAVEGELAGPRSAQG